MSDPDSIGERLNSAIDRIEQGFTHPNARDLQPLLREAASALLSLQAGWRPSDQDIERCAQAILEKRGKYRYAYTEKRALSIITDILLDLRDVLALPSVEGG